MLDLFDQGRITRITMVTDVSFPKLKHTAAAVLLDGLAARGQRYLAAPTHAKIMLIGAVDAWYTMEGSANFTSNPRIEQQALTNDRGLYEFHRAWIDDLIRRNDPKAEI
jgi:hypothetical protein